MLIRHQKHTFSNILQLWTVIIVVIRHDNHEVNCRNSLVTLQECALACIWLASAAPFQLTFRGVGTKADPGSIFLPGNPALFHRIPLCIGIPASPMGSIQMWWEGCLFSCRANLHTCSPTCHQGKQQVFTVGRGSAQQDNSHHYQKMVYESWAVQPKHVGPVLDCFVKYFYVK